MRGLHVAAIALLVACGAPAIAQGQAVTSSSAAQSPVDLSGLWVISNRSDMGPLDESGAKITANVYTESALKARASVRPAYDPSAMCVPAMPRHQSGPYPIQIVHSGGKVAMLYEWDSIFRLIHLDAAEHPDPLEETRWLGHSIGRWEGSTLVVDTANFNGKAWLDGGGTPMSEKARLTERFNLSADGKTLQIDMTIEDPEVFTRKINRKYVFNLRNDWQIKEYLCSEGNRDNVFQNKGEMGSLQEGDVIE
jgi:hypothetical protein